MVHDHDEARAGHLVPLDAGWGLWRLAVLRSAGLPFATLACLAVTDELALPPGSERDAAIRARESAAVDALLADDTLVTALAWQNPKAMRDWVLNHRAALRAGRGGFPARRRDGRQAFLARCVQRYAAKNDTVGFFGPVAWARFDADTTGVHGTGELTNRDVSYEVWAVHGVAAAWARQPDVLPYLPIRLDPACAVDGDVVRRPRRSPVPLGPLLGLLDEAGTVGELAERAGMSLAAVAEEIARLRELEVVQVGFLVPLHERPEEFLRRQVATIPDPAVAQRLLAWLDRLDEAKAELAGASGPEATMAALAALDAELLAAADDHRPTAAAGPGPGRRTPVYLDCRRDLDATIAPAETALLAEPLGILLDSARWLTGQLGEVVGDALTERYHRLRASRDVITLGDLQFASADLLSTGGSELADVVADFQLRWAELIESGRETDGETVLDVARARTLADALFPGCPPPWATARVHSPDVMLARTPDGGVRWVLGELHVALNTTESRVFGTQADDIGELVDAVRGDLPTGRVVPVYPNDGLLVSSRTYPPPALDPEGLYRYWSTGTDDGHPTGVRSTPAAGLVLSERDGELVAVSERDGWAAPVLECFGEYLTAVAVNLFHLRPPAARAPRLVLGDVVISRASWRFAHGEVPVAGPRSRDIAHDGLRAWAAGHGLPRHVFVRTPLERKPFYVDFDAPLLVEDLARVVRKGADWVEVSEMLPAPDQLWLTDPHGRRYTSEFRLVTVDPAEARPVLRPVPVAAGLSAR